MRFLPVRCRTFCTGTAFPATSQITRCARLGQIEYARKLFDAMPSKPIVSWNQIISGYFQNYMPGDARLLFDKMPDRNIVSWNGMVSGYVRNKMVKEARKVFDRMPVRNVLSWTAMIRGYVEDGLISEAESLFRQMPMKNVISWTVMLGGLIQAGRVDEARNLFDAMPVRDVVARTNMVAGYCQEGRLAEARMVFDEMPYRNVISWTAMINGYAQNQQVDVARKLFEVMPEKNEVSWTAMLQGYTQCGRMEEATQLFKAMPAKSLPACNAMILGFGLNQQPAKARELFDLMPERDEGSWSAMIKCCERNSRELEALELFTSMQREKLPPNYPSLISALCVCASLACLDHGRQIHAHLFKSQLDNDVYVASVLMTMYIKCGDLVKAKSVFSRSSSKDLVMWNSIISGYAQHGLGVEALKAFDEMNSLGITPDPVTFVCVLSACSYTGMFKAGIEIFESMRFKYGVEPGTEHYACMVDLLVRAGHIKEAMSFIIKMPIDADAIIWGSLLGGCRTHGNLEFAKVAANKLAQLEPQNAGPYILLSNLYASKGRWRDVSELRKKMQSRKVSKSPGCSWIEVEKKVHTFTGGQSVTHPEHPLIAKKLELLNALLKESGYCPDGNFVLHDVDEEEKVQSLGYHSEKLAVAYGLLKLPEGMPIRVIKNLRVCGDCHSAIKLIAKVTGREIILRDANRFHHFKSGLCSCQDYW